jgi:hypothetical protein
LETYVQAVTDEKRQAQSKLEQAQNKLEDGSFLEVTKFVRADDVVRQVKPKEQREQGSEALFTP